jgi:excisionase family DNA binding protein
MSTHTFEPLLDDKQAGELLGLHCKTVQRLARRGEIPAVRIGRYWRYRARVFSNPRMSLKERERQRMKDGSFLG